MDDLSNALNASKIGCVSGNIIINHLMYADDLVLLCTYSKGLATLLKICARYGIANDILYNSNNSTLLFMSTKDDKNLVLPIFQLNDEVLPVVEVTKYLGHFFNNDLLDDKDILRQCCKLYGQCNMLIYIFNMCTVDVKVSLFRTFCTPLYTTQLWWNHFDYSLNKLKVAYNDIMCMLLRLPRWHGATEIVVNINVPTC